MKGFTLLEVMMATAIISIGALIGIYYSSMQVNNYEYDEHVILATQLGSDVLEGLLLRDAASDPLLAAGSHSQFYDDKFHLSTTASSYTVSWNIQLDTPYPNILTINETTKWNNGTLPTVVKLTTYRNME